MAEVVWRGRATRQLTDIHLYIHERNPTAAKDYAAGLREACEGLRHFPEKARQLNSRYRALIYRNHLAIYRYDRSSERVFVVAIIHAQRDVQSLMKWLKD